MNCKKIQKQILTDYIDEQIGQDQKRLIEDHLSSCVHCREFAETAKTSIISPFFNIEKVVPSDQVWLNIKESIEQEPVNENLGYYEDFFRRLKDMIAPKRLAYALAGVFVIILVAMAAIKINQPLQEIAVRETQQESEAITYLVKAIQDDELDENGDYGTAIEEYFL